MPRCLLLEQIISKRGVRKYAPIKPKHSSDRYEELTQRDSMQQTQRKAWNQSKN